MSIKHFLGATALAAGLAFSLSPAVSGTIEAHQHISHVMKNWGETPNAEGLLPVALADAEVAAKHAGYGAADTSDLTSMKLHAGHVRDAIAPEGDVAVGSGFGVKRAAKGVVQHVNLAADSKDASKAVKTHAVHVATSAQNTIGRVHYMMKHIKAIDAATTAEDAKPHMEKLHTLAKALIEGTDKDGDGKITWKEGEGGLAASNKHMGFMMKAENISY
ncbi:hypothetical protein [Coralliovum pocilloporae]|uniref:hypothetical protein n=1 Tax=Coralliovum pocilloporae TaxID=3066369 RepID=UPI0033074205